MAQLWLRLHTSVARTAKLQLLDAEDFRTLINLWCLTKEHDGTLPPIREIAWNLHRAEAEMLEAMERLRGEKLLDFDGATWRPHDWGQWQFASDGPAAANERKRKQRAKTYDVTAQKNDSQNGSHNDVTPTCHNDVTTESRRCHATEQSRAEQIQSRVDTPLPPLDEPTPVELCTKRITDAYPKGISAHLVAQAIVDQAGPTLQHLEAIERNTLAWCECWADEPQYAPNVARWIREGGWLKPPPKVQLAPTSGVTDEEINAIIAANRRADGKRKSHSSGS